MQTRTLKCAGALLLLLAVSAARAQTLQRDAFADLSSAPGRLRGAQAPRLAFSLIAEIPLPGPLPGGGPRWSGDEVEIAVAGGTAITHPTPDATPRLERAVSVTPTDGAPDPWVVEPGGRHRYRSLPGGWILSERRCRRCSDGWKKRWKLRVAGNTLAPPLLHGKRLFFGALDNRVYCVRTKNGHRVWATEVGGRISNPLVLWSAETPSGNAGDSPAPRLDVILVVPDGGAEMLALGGRQGGSIATVQLAPDDGKLISVPLTDDDGRIVVARQKYAESEASLMVYRFTPTVAELETAPEPGKNGPPRTDSDDNADESPAPDSVSARRPAPDPR